MNDTKNLKEEFGEYLKDHWEERETLPVADWWIEKLQGAVAEDRANIRRDMTSKMYGWHGTGLGMIDDYYKRLDSLDNEAL